MLAENCRLTVLPVTVVRPALGPGTVRMTLGPIGCRFSIHAASSWGKFCRATLLFIFFQPMNWSSLVDCRCAAPGSACAGIVLRAMATSRVPVTGHHQVPAYQLPLDPSESSSSHPSAEAAAKYTSPGSHPPAHAARD